MLREHLGGDRQADCGNERASSNSCARARGNGDQPGLTSDLRRVRPTYESSESSAYGGDEIPRNRTGGSHCTVEALKGLGTAELRRDLADRLGECAGPLRHHPGR